MPFQTIQCGGKRNLPGIESGGAEVPRSDQKIIPFMAKKKAETLDKSSISAS